LWSRIRYVQWLPGADGYAVGIMVAVVTTLGGGGPTGICMELCCMGDGCCIGGGWA